METLYLNKKTYRGAVAYINGYNGYTETKDHGKLCALIKGSCWDKNGKARVLRTHNGKIVLNKDIAGSVSKI